ncbi:MAG: hypothetical protein IKT79_05245 [Akkermansia sp.]|nr:hypothetical protein [Akkermansia sp.]
MNATWSLLPAICMAATADEGTNALFYRLANECCSLAEAIHDTASADLHAAPLKTRGSVMLWIGMTAAFKGGDVEPDEALQEKLLAEVQRIKAADFYGSRIMMAAYEEDKLASLPPPTEEEKARVRGQLIDLLKSTIQQASGINDKERAETYALDRAAALLMARYAMRAALIQPTSDAGLQPLLHALHEADSAVKARVKAHGYYGSRIVTELLR